MKIAYFRPLAVENFVYFTFIINIKSVFRAWASSAPVLLFKNGGPRIGSYYNITSRTFLRSGCTSDNIISAFNSIDNLATDSAGIKQLNAIFRLSPKSMLNSTADVDDFLKPYVRYAFESLVELDYPYPADFLAPLPKWPVRVGQMALFNAEHAFF